MNKILSLSLVLILMGFFTWCLKKVQVEKTRTITTVELVQNITESGSDTQDGITVKVSPVDVNNFNQHASLNSPISYWWYAKYSDESFVRYRDGSIKKYSKTMNLNLVALPAFEVKITNSTDHVLRFSKSVIAVEDDRGNIFDGLQKSDMQDYLTTNLQNQVGNKVYLYDQTQNDLRGAIRNIRLLDHNLKILPGKTVKTYAVANYGHYSLSDSKEFLLNLSKITFGLYEVPSKVNDAGENTKTVNFNFVFDVKSEQKTEKYKTYVYQ